MTAVQTNRFTPQEARPSYLAPVGTTQTDTSARVTAQQAALQQMLAAHPNGTNLAFDPGTLGDSSYLTDVPNQTITRGYIRRASPDSSDVMSAAQLNFMYNPEQVVRDYVSYLDQEALDPFNTVYQSGNLIAPPSFINFSFDLFFDRQVQTVQGVTPRGVLEDYDFFDIVVRNVAPGGGTTAVPDNGIMMVNPKDIMVVFSKDLSVQGRPTNARVTFEKFDNTMTPVRMTVSLTMIVTYFGPLRDAFTFDTSQAISAWEGTISYAQVYSEDVTQADVDAAQAAYKKQAADTATFLNAIPRTASWAGAATTGTGVAAVALPASGKLATDTLALAMQNIHGATYSGGAPPPLTAYTQGSGRTNLPFSGDCSGALWWCYNKLGASLILHGSSGPANTDSIRQHGQSTGWKTMAIVCIPSQTSDAQLRSLVQAGDVLLRSPNNGHCGIFHSWDATGWWIVHQTTPPHNGTAHQSISYMKTFNWVLRPNPSGSTTSTGTWP